MLRSTSLRRLEPKAVMRLAVEDWCRSVGIPMPEFEHEFHPTRKWRFDFCWPAAKVAIEQEGGIWVVGRHTRGAGYLKDMEKYNAANDMDWYLFRYTPKQIIDGDWLSYVVPRVRVRVNDGRYDGHYS